MSVEVKSVSHEYVERGMTLMGVEQEYAIGVILQLLLGFITGTLRKRKIRVLEDVNLTVHKGELLGLIGVNGSGKTTLLKIIGGLLRPIKGDVLIDGYSMIREESVARKRVMYIPGALVGGYIMSPFLSVRINLKKLFELYGAQTAKVDEALKIAGLEKFADRRVGSLSSGLAARLVLISILYSEAPILLFDEPVVGISVEAVASFYEFIKERLWKEKGATIIYATNNVNEAQRLCKKIVILHDGKILVSGSLHELVSRIGLKDVVELKIHQPYRSDKIENIFSELVEKYQVKQSENGYHDVRLLTANSEEILPQLFERIVSGGGKIMSMKVHDVSLEDVFLYYIRNQEGVS